MPVPPGRIYHIYLTKKNPLPDEPDNGFFAKSIQYYYIIRPGSFLLITVITGNRNRVIPIALIIIIICMYLLFIV